MRASAKRRSGTVDLTELIMDRGISPAHHATQVLRAARDQEQAVIGSTLWRPAALALAALAISHGFGLAAQSQQLRLLQCQCPTHAIVRWLPRPPFELVSHRRCFTTRPTRGYFSYNNSRAAPHAPVLHLHTARAHPRAAACPGDAPLLSSPPRMQHWVRRPSSPTPAPLLPPTLPPNAQTMSAALPHPTLRPLSPHAQAMPLLPLPAAPCSCNGWLLIRHEL